MVYSNRFLSIEGFVVGCKDQGTNIDGTEISSSNVRTVGLQFAFFINYFISLSPII